MSVQQRHTSTGTTDTRRLQLLLQLLQPQDELISTNHLLENSLKADFSPHLWLLKVKKQTLTASAVQVINLLEADKIRHDKIQ